MTKPGRDCGWQHLQGTHQAIQRLNWALEFCIPQQTYVGMATAVYDGCLEMVARRRSVGIPRVLHGHIRTLPESAYGHAIESLSIASRAVSLRLTHLHRRVSADPSRALSDEVWREYVDTEDAIDWGWRVIIRNEIGNDPSTACSRRLASKDYPLLNYALDTTEIASLLVGRDIRD